MDLKRLKALPPEEQAKLYERLGKVRHAGKQAGYSAMYGAQPKTIAHSAKINIDVATKLHTAYWKLNWSIPATCEALVTKKCSGQLWQWNPVSEMWYSLRHMKDQWSTLNQGTGVWCFDVWVRNLRSLGMPVCGQMHDEVIGAVKEGNRKFVTKAIRKAMTLTNEELKLNRELDCSLDFGSSYAQIH